MALPIEDDRLTSEQLWTEPLLLARQRVNKGIVYRRLAGPGPSRTLAVIWRKHRYHSIAAERFLDVLRAYGRT